MMNLTAKIITRPPDAETIAKNIRFGTAVGLTKTVKDGQAAVFSALHPFFTIRGRWFEQGNKFGIRTKSATPNDLSAEVRTNADWLQKQKEGGIIPGAKDERIFHYTYGGVRYIAVPSRALRPRGSQKIIQKALWPSTLRKKKGTFVIKSRKTGTLILMTRFASGKTGYEAMYILVPDISIKSKDAFYEPITKVVTKNLSINIEREIQKALSTIRSK